MLCLLALAAGLAGASFSPVPALAAEGEPAGVTLSPTALAVAHDGKSLFIACASADRVLRLNLPSQRLVDTFKMPAAPSGLAVSRDGSRLFVTCAAPESRICVVNLASGRIACQIRAGHTAMAPVLCPDDRTLLVCNRFNNDVSVIDLQARRELRRIAVRREPVAATLAQDGRYLLVANLLPTGRADTGTVAAVVSVIDWSAGRVIKELSLPDGSTSCNGLQASSDGKYALVTHTLSRYRLPAIQVDRGWMNANAMTIIELGKLEVLNTVLLDDGESGAANPWGIAWSADNQTVVIAHAGTHEISLINFPALLTKLLVLPTALSGPPLGPYGTAARVRADVPNDLSFLGGARRRIKLGASDRGPRAAVMIGNRVYVANYFSDTVTAVDASPEVSAPQSIPLGPRHELDLVHRGELLFHDASICYQGWQSCATCHPGNARKDGLTWDLINDGVGNPKNTKSLLLAPQTPPSMSLGVRADASAAVRAGIEHILFARPSEGIVRAIDEYLKSLKPVPSPRLVNGKLSRAAERGKKTFSQAGCARCHVPPLYTDLHPYDVGTRATYDGPTDKFYTPTLIEVWRTAPYLHDGSAATIQDVLTTQNRSGLHGDVSGLSGRQLDDLCAFVLSL